MTCGFSSAAHDVLSLCEPSPHPSPYLPAPPEASCLLPFGLTSVHGCFLLASHGMFWKSGEKDLEQSFVRDWSGRFWIRPFPSEGLSSLSHKVAVVGGSGVGWLDERPHEQFPHLIFRGSRRPRKTKVPGLELPGLGKGRAGVAGCEFSEMWNRCAELPSAGVEGVSSPLGPGLPLLPPTHLSTYPHLSLFVTNHQVT